MLHHGHVAVCRRPAFRSSATRTSWDQSNSQDLEVLPQGASTPRIRCRQLPCNTSWAQIADVGSMASMKCQPWLRHSEKHTSNGVKGPSTPLRSIGPKPVGVLPVDYVSGPKPAQPNGNLHRALEASRTSSRLRTNPKGYGWFLYPHWAFQRLLWPRLLAKKKHRNRPFPEAPDVFRARCNRLVLRPGPKHRSGVSNGGVALLEPLGPEKKERRTGEKERRTGKREKPEEREYPPRKTRENTGKQAPHSDPQTSAGRGPVPPGLRRRDPGAARAAWNPLASPGCCGQSGGRTPDEPIQSEADPKCNPFLGNVTGASLSGLPSIAWLSPKEHKSILQPIRGLFREKCRHLGFGGRFTRLQSIQAHEIQLTWFTDVDSFRLDIYY